jgi:subtilisin family serine protease
MKLAIVFFAFIFASLAMPLVEYTDYIVVFRQGVASLSRTNHIQRFGSRVFANYSIGTTFNGFAVRMTSQEAVLLQASADVAYIEQDQEVHISQVCNVQQNAVWGINRISEREIELSGEYHYDTDGTGVTAFIIDTGIRTTHEQFTGRASWGANYAGDGQNTDCNGHGTHVAVTVGGRDYGVAKKVTLVAVKVLGCSGSGTWAGVISGIQYAGNSKARPAVANMSLGGLKNQAVNDAVKAAVAQGVVFAVAGGNDNSDACNYSPASELSAICVGATTVADVGNTQEDRRSSFSNYGKCVDILAPGSLVKSAWHTSDTATNTISGTSMAAPHVCGVAALYLAENTDATPAQVATALGASSTSDVVDLGCAATNQICLATPNKLLWSACS